MFISLFYSINLFAAQRVINLVVGYKTVNFAGKLMKAIAVNNQIPAPTLHFKEGDHVSINVYNRLDENTAIHWHGILVPWQMDGVLGVNQKAIKRGQSFHYEFTLKQAGTYWYHAHAGLQEQQGLYGAFIIDSRKQTPYNYNRDYVVILSDWSNTHPEQIFANLKKEGDYYSPRFPLQPSLSKFIHDYQKANLQERKKLIDDYKMMQQMRMNIYDLSDVGFDVFLLNGQPPYNPWRAPISVGDVVRLRFIGAGGSTIFQVKIPNTTMQMIHIQGNDVVPYTVNDFKIAPGETYDVLVKINQDKPYIIYAESSDTVGAAIGALVTHSQQLVDYSKVTPFAEPLPVIREMMDNMMMANMHKNSYMGEDCGVHDGAPRSRRSSCARGSQILKSITTPGTKYQNLIAALPTNNPNKPIKGIIKMELFGYMDRFIWFVNGLPEYRAKPIILAPGERYRIVFTNTSMMHHPMHIHGHWFILRKGLGSYDPLLHTIDVAPGATVVTDLDTDASGQWFFHCHLLYHMITGMSRVFQYSSLIEITPEETSADVRNYSYVDSSDPTVTAIATRYPANQACLRSHRPRDDVLRRGLQHKAKSCSVNFLKPQNIIANTKYYNRPIVRVDEVKPIDYSLVKHPMAHPMGLLVANFLDISADPFKNFQQLNFKGWYGYDYNKLELLIKDATINQDTVEDGNIDVFYWHLIAQFWAVKGGANYFYQPVKKSYWQPGIGIEGLMPYFIATDIRSYYYGGSTKVDLELSRDTQITNNFFIKLGIRSILASKTIPRAEIGNGLNQVRYTLRPYYRLIPGLNIFAEYEYVKNYGSFKTLENNAGRPVTENSLTLGVRVIF